MGSLDQFGRKKKKGPRSQGEPPPELLQALQVLMSLPPQVAQRLTSVRSEQELMQLLAEDPELIPVLEQAIQQPGRLAPSASAPAQHSSGFTAELARAPLEVQQIVLRLGQPVTDPRQEVQRLWLFEQTQTLVDRRQSPQLWVVLQNEFANSLRQTPVGDRAKNLERAITACSAALEVCTRADFPIDWAMTQNNLGAAYAERIRGDQAENLEQAIAAYTAALEVYTRADFPVDWAMIQNNLGHAYRNRIRGDRAENLEQAIAFHEAALEVRTRADLPVDWADTQNKLGAALRGRIRGDRAENLEQAIAAYNAALEVFTRDGFPVQWATIQHNLGNALRERIRGDRAENLERAIAAYNAALKVHARADFPVRWASTQHRLGEAYFCRIWGDREENLEQTIAAYTAALEVYTRTDFPVGWAGIQNDLVAAYAERIRGDQAENLEQAIAACIAALEVYTRADFPLAWAMLQNNLGGALRDRIQGDQAENLEQAIVAFQSAIDGAQTMGIRDEERNAAGNLGHLHYKEGQWLPAYVAFDTAVAAVETMRTEYFSEEAKTRLVGENAWLYACMTDACLHLGHSQEALERAEAGKGRLFLDQLNTDFFQAPALPPEQQPLLERETDLLNELRGLEHAIRNAPDETRRRQFVAPQGERQANLKKVWVQLEPHAPEYVALRKGDPVKYDDIQAVVDGFGPAAALVEFCVLPDQVIIFVVRSGEQGPEVTHVPISQDQLLRHVQTYWREVVQYPQHGDIGQHWQEMAEPLLADVLPHLDGAELVYLVPQDLLHYLPLHALRVDGEYLIDRFSIAYAPSAAVLKRVIQRRAGIARTGQPKALVAGNPTLDLPHAETEAKRVAQLFDVRPYLGGEASKAVVQSELADKDVIHLACHGYFHPTRPLQSGVVFTGKAALTAQEIMGLRLQADIVTLSACETGRSEVSRGDELVGLTRALLYAGASSVLVSLWAVHDESTGQLMTDFYRRLYDGTGHKVRAEAMALREAMLEARKKREHPYYWAPFVLVGDWR